MSHYLPAVNTFLNRGEADRQILKQMIDELETVPEWKELATVLRKATPPLRLSNGTEPWLRELYPDEGLGRIGMKSVCQRGRKHGEAFVGDRYA